MGQCCSRDRSLGAHQQRMLELHRRSHRIKSQRAVVRANEIHQSEDQCLNLGQRSNLGRLGQRTMGLDQDLHRQRRGPTGTLGLLRQFERVVYVSCNPETLKRDLSAVADAYEIERFAMFDQFPYTHHVECGVYLRRKPDAAAEEGEEARRVKARVAESGGGGEGEGDAAEAAAPS